MNFDLSETQELFRNTAERFLRNVDTATRAKIRENESGYDRARWQELAELGLLAIAADEEHGGLSGASNDLTVIGECFGNNNACDPWLENGILPVRLLNLAKHTELLNNVLDGSKIAALAFAEETNRYALMPDSTSATKSGDGYTLSGNKKFVLGAAIADTFLVTAQCDNEFGLFAVAKDNKGVTAEYYRIADGSQAAMISFDNVALSANDKLNLDFNQFQGVIGEINLIGAAEMVGLSQRLLDDTIAYVKEREQFGVAIGSFQVIQHALVDCYTELEQIRSLLLRTVLLEQEPLAEWIAEVAGANAFIAERSNKIAQDAVQYHGAMGITDEASIGHAMKRVMTLARLFGCPTTKLRQYMDAA